MKGKEKKKPNRVLKKVRNRIDKIFPNKYVITVITNSGEYHKVGFPTLDEAEKCKKKLVESVDVLEIPNELGSTNIIYKKNVESILLTTFFDAPRKEIRREDDR